MGLDPLVFVAYACQGERRDRLSSSYILGHVGKKQCWSGGLKYSIGRSLYLLWDTGGANSSRLHGVNSSSGPWNVGVVLNRLVPELVWGQRNTSLVYKN